MNSGIRLRLIAKMDLQQAWVIAGSDPKEREHLMNEYEITEKLDEANRLIEEAKEMSIRYNQYVNYYKGYIAVEWVPMDMKEAIRIVEEGRFDQLTQDEKKRVIDTLKGGLSAAEDYWQSSGGAC